MSRASVLRFEPSPRLCRALAGASAIAAGLCVAGLFVAPQRVWVGVLAGFVFLTGLGLAGALFLGLCDAAGARWMAALRRVPEAMTSAILPAGAIGLVLLFGVHSLYEWSHESAVQADAVLQAKSPYLNLAGFAARLVVFFVVWTWFARRLVRGARGVSEGGEAADRATRVRRAAGFMALFAVTWSLASFDWLMSLEPHWYSTIYALMSLAGVALSGLAAATLLVIGLRRVGALRGVVTGDHLHDLSKLLFSLSLFWGYIAYCQYMLVWYTNIPEETVHYAARADGLWRTLTVVSVVLNLGVPFVALLWRRARRSEKVLVRVCTAVLVGRAVELLVAVAPAVQDGPPVLGVWEVAPIVGAVALFLFVTLRAVARAPAVPTADPDVAYSLHYHA